MVVLGIDTSCDDTSVAVVRKGREILSNIVSSQTALHGLFGGIVPELASRRHIELIDRIYEAALTEAGLGPDRIDALAVTTGPGLIGSLLVGLCFAKGLALSLRKPVAAVNHIHAHALSILLQQDVTFPYIGLVVSGGHTMILLVEDPLTFNVLGTTRDDAAGEAFDKVAKYLGIGYPGGRAIEERALAGKRDFVAFPRPMADEQNYDFSFSGLKTSFINYMKKQSGSDYNLNDILASFQEAVFDVLWLKVLKAARGQKVERIVVGGGVASNGTMRAMFGERSVRDGVQVFFSDPGFCTDNAAMIALVGYHRAVRGAYADLSVKAFSRMRVR
jgi:N6-L-threonylcarbamoyladenine synthase